MSTPASSATVSSADFHNLLAFMAACGPKCWLAGRRPGLDHLTKMSASRHAKVIKVLDALALICVRTTGDAFAVAAEIEHSSTTLTVAENNGCYDGTVAHLCRVWDILQRITHKLHQPHPLDSHKEAPPPVLKVPDELYNELCGAVYDHSFAKFNRRIKKARDVAVELGRLILPIRQGGSSEWDDLYDILVNINSVFNYCKNVEDPEFILCIFELSRTCQTFFNPMQRKVAKLAASFKKFDAVNFERKVHRAIMIQNAIDTLVAMVKSKDMSRLFNCDLKVDTLEPQQSVVGHQLPEDFAGWNAVVQKAITVCDAEISKGDVLKKVLDSAVKKYEGKQPHCVVHCEANIIDHFAAAASSSSRQPVPYIGVCKLSCKSCDAFLRAYNATNPKVRFYTRRGAGGKWDFPWKLPTRYEKSRLMQHMYEDVCVDLFNYL